MCRGGRSVSLCGADHQAKVRCQRPAWEGCPPSALLGVATCAVVTEHFIGSRAALHLLVTWPPSRSVATRRCGQLTWRGRDLGPGPCPVGEQ
eukprot:366311-Chlamydomonas_euryale.AAC.14